MSSAYQWLHRIEDLPTPPIIQRTQWQNLRETIDEIQQKVITGLRCDDGTISVMMKEGEAVLSAPTSQDTEEFTATLSLVAYVQWANPILQYLPLILTIEKGRIVGLEVGDLIVIDTAEACP